MTDFETVDQLGLLSTAEVALWRDEEFLAQALTQTRAQGLPASCAPSLARQLQAEMRRLCADGVSVVDALSRLEEKYGQS